MPFVKDQRIVGTRSKVVNAIGMRVVKFCEFLGKDIDWDTFPFEWNCCSLLLLDVDAE